MSQYPILKKEVEKKETSKVYKSIAPTAVTNTKQISSSSNQPLQKNVPAFLNKLYSMVNDPESDDLICWADDGASFFVNRQEDFARKVLPRFFKHNKFSSFVRQLNMYGFHKVPHLQQGVLETDSESERWEFSNPHFQRNQPDLLLLVTRKKGPATDEKEISSIDLQHILEEIQSIKKHQMNISGQLQSIQRDNQVLWQETVQARERHLRHQETIDKILRFLASVFSSGDKRPAIPRKRRFLLGPADGNDLEADVDLPQVHNLDNSDEKPAKIPRQQSHNDPVFNIDDYVNGKSDLTGLSTILPAHLKSSTTTPSSDLDDAIALNDQSKHEASSIIDFSDMNTNMNSSKISTSINNSNNSNINDNNIPQLPNIQNMSNIQNLQNLQSLIALAQANPDLLNQLTTDTFFGTNTPTSVSSQPQVPLMIDNINSNSTTPLATPPIPSVLSSDVTPSNTTVRSLSQVSNSISNISDSADALNQDIDELGLSLQLLAQQLGFDPSKVSSNDLADIGNTKLGDQTEEEDLLDMDEFLNTFGSDIHPDDTTLSTTDVPFINNNRSPSPVVTTPSSTK